MAALGSSYADMTSSFDTLIHRIGARGGVSSTWSAQSRLAVNPSKFSTALVWRWLEMGDPDSDAADMQTPVARCTHTARSPAGRKKTL